MTTYTDPLVSDAQLVELSGYTRPGDQAKWLKEKGIAYAIGRDGRPRTTWGLVEEALRGNDGYGTSGKAA